MLLWAILAGVGMALAAPPLSWSVLAWVSWIPLWWVVLPIAPPPGVTPGQVALLWSLAHYGILLHWIWDLHPLTWMGVPWLASVAIAIGAWLGIVAIKTGLVLIWTLTLTWLLRHLPAPAVIPGSGSVTGRSIARSVITSLLLGLALWQGLQTLLSWTPLTWSTLALTQSPQHPVLLHLGQLSGPLTLDGLIVGVNGLLAWGIWSVMQRRWVGVGLLLGTVALVGVGAGTVAQGLATGAIDDRPEAAISMGLIQGNVPTREKLSVAGVRRAETRYSEGYRTLSAGGANVVVLPEGALPVLWEGLNRAHSLVYQTVRQGTVPMWVGTFLRPEADRSGDFTQSLIAVNPGGTITARYDKVKLVPLGEYVPFRAVLSRILGKLSPIESTMLPGLPPQEFVTPWGSAAIAICYEPFFPAIVRQQVAAGSRFIITSSNLDPYGPVLMAQHEAQDVIQAITVDRWLLRVTNTGYSGFISPRGMVQRDLAPQTFGTAIAPIYPRESRTPYVRWGDWLTPLWAVLATLAVLAPVVLAAIRG